MPGISDSHSDATQAAQILSHLRAGHRITPMEALDLFGCFRLGARIWELCKAGFKIGKCMKRVTSERTGRPARVAEYYLEADSAVQEPNPPPETVHA